MPNWCSNQLIVCGPDTWVDLFKEQITVADGGYEILNKLYPCPEDLSLPSQFGNIPDDDPNKEKKLSNLEQYGSPDWYDWCNTNWGTKWGDCDTEFIDDYNYHTDGIKTSMYRFQTAWSPPEAGMIHISESFKSLIFDLRYQEPGMGFTGWHRMCNGETISEGCADWFPDCDYVFETLADDYDYDMGRASDDKERTEGV